MRPSFDNYFLTIASVVSTRATCDRKKVGAVLVDRFNRIVSTGYNGSPAGLPHCDDVGHELVDMDGRQSCVRTVHAESNALYEAGQKVPGGTLFTTAIPCYDCAKLIVNAGISRVVYCEYYNSRKTESVLNLLGSAGIQTIGPLEEVK